MLVQARRRPPQAPPGLAQAVGRAGHGDRLARDLLLGEEAALAQMLLLAQVGHVVDRVVFKTERGYGPAYFITSILAQIVFGILATAIVSYFSRLREFRADAGGAGLAGREKMIAALQRLQAVHEPSQLPDQMVAFGINAGLSEGLRKLFMSHPPLSERIAALQARG